MGSWWKWIVLSCCTISVSCNIQVIDDTTFTPCELATPQINYSQNTVNLSDSLLDRGEKAWIGYVKDAVLLQYIGCISVANITDQNIVYTEVATSRDVGQCYSACSENHTVIGLQANTITCKCFENATNIKTLYGASEHCTTACGSFVCGANNHISVYEKVKTSIVTDDTRADNCLSLSRNGYVWKNCNSTLLKVACVKDLKNLSASSEWLYWKKWLKGVNRCFKLGKYPMPYIKSKNVNWLFDRWTGVIQTVAIREIAASDYPNLLFGYVEKTENGYQLKFTADSDMTDSSICFMRDASTTVSTTTSDVERTSANRLNTPSTDGFRTISGSSPPTFMTTSLMSSASIQTTERTINTPTNTRTMTHAPTTIPTPSSTTSASMDQNYLPQDSKTDKPSVGLFIGPPLAVISLLGIVVIACVLWRKRIPPKDEDKTAELQNNDVHHNNIFDTGYANAASDDIDRSRQATNRQTDVSYLAKDSDCQQTNGHSYFVLEKVNHETEYAEVSDTDVPVENTIDNVYFVLHKEEKQPDMAYHTNSIPAQILEESKDKHIYNTCDPNIINQDVDEYDHIGNDMRRIEDSGYYDVTFATKPNDPTYDSTLNNSGNTFAKDGLYDRPNFNTADVYTKG